MLKYLLDVDSIVFICDVCQEPIEDIASGMAYWDDDKDLITAHQFKCDPGKSYACSLSLKEVLEQIGRRYQIRIAKW